MDERDFKLLAVLNETKNITHAADLLFLTQSSLSKRIKLIEQELKVTLLLRSRQGIHFTPEGEIVLKHVTQATQLLKAMRTAIDATKEEIHGTLNAGISVNYALYRLPQVLTQFRNHYPHVNFNLVTEHSRNLYMQILNGKLDVAIIRGEYQWLGAKFLLDRESICLIKSNAQATIALSDLPYIGRKTDTVFERELAKWLYEQNLQPEHNGIYVDSITTCVEMVKRGLGWAIVPEICMTNFEGDITKLYFADGEPLVRSTYLICSETAMKLPQVKAFIEVVRQSNPEENPNV